MTLRQAIEGTEYLIQKIVTEDEEMDAFLFSLGCFAGEKITVALAELERAVKDLLREELEQLYDFDLMEGGGHLTGWFVPDYIAADVVNYLYTKGDPMFAVADGNHAVAAAKQYWEEVLTMNSNSTIASRWSISAIPPSCFIPSTAL